MAKISNSRIFSIIAATIGKKSIALKDGKLDLSDEERAKIESVYGAEFLNDLEEVAAGNDDANSLFDKMVQKAKEQDEKISKLESEKAELQKSVKALSEEPEPQPRRETVDPGAKVKTFEINTGAMHNKLAAQALAGGFGPAMATASTSSVDVSELNEEFGKVMPPQTRIEILAKRIYNGFNDAKYFRKISSNTDYKATDALITEVSQQFTPKWTPKGAIKFTPVTIPYRRHKINTLVNATQILESWLQYLWEQGKKPIEMPITKYIVEQHVLPKVTDDITLSMIGKGSFVDHNDGTVTDGTAGFAAKDSMDGYETILVKGKSDSSCKFNFFKNAVDYTTLTSQQLLNYVDSFVDAISPLFARIFNVYCAPEFLTAYKRADFAVNGKYSGEESDGKIRFTKFSLVSLESMYASKIIFATPEGNMAMVVDYARAESCINMFQEENYDVKIFGEYSLSVGFLIAEAVYAAVPAGYTPSESIASNPMEASDAWENGGAGSGSGSGSGSGEGL